MGFFVQRDYALFGNAGRNLKKVRSFAAATGDRRR